MVRTYTTRLREISFEKVPNEFHYAYMEHIHAWEEMRSLLEKSPTNGDASVLLGLLGIAAGQPKLGVPALVSGVQANASSKSKQDAERQVASDQIRQTWNKIELLVVKYGAKIPKAGGE